MFALKWPMMKEKQAWKKICGQKVTISALYFKNFRTACSEENRNQHNIETCKIKIVGPANRSYSENTMETKQQYQQITNNDKLRKNKGEWHEVTAQTSRWRQTLRLVTNNVINIHNFIQHFRMIDVSSTKFVQLSPKGTSHFTLQTRCRNVYAV